MPETPPIPAAYAESFRCIGSACEDTCCQGWAVPIDQAAYEKYQNLPASPLRTLINTNILVTPQRGEETSGARPSSFAILQMTAENQCPLLTPDRLCRIHAELGEELVSHACATYPRIRHSTGGIEETALSLSCPEAARLVLLDPDLPARQLAAANRPVRQDAELSAADGCTSLLPWFWPIRQNILALLANRAYPLWQRLFLLGVFCRRMDAIACGDLVRSVPAFLGDFEATVASGALRTAMETLPVDRAAQLDVVLRLAGMLLHRSNVRPRFVECVQAFTAGIGNGADATLESLAAQYALIHDRCYEPFFELHPHILENYLANTIVRCRFPFGRAGAQAEAPLAQAEVPFSMAREFALLAAQFALMKGLLIGVAGFHGEAFSSAHVVHTVQAAGKHFEHHPEFLDLAYRLLADSQMEGARGLAILLRNREPEAVSNAASPAPPETQAPSRQDGSWV